MWKLKTESNVNTKQELALPTSPHSGLHRPTFCLILGTPGCRSRHDVAVGIHIRSFTSMFIFHHSPLYRCEDGRQLQAWKQGSGHCSGGRRIR